MDGSSVAVIIASTESRSRRWARRSGPSPNVRTSWLRAASIWAMHFCTVRLGSTTATRIPPCRLYRFEREESDPDHRREFPDQQAAAADTAVLRERDDEIARQLDLALQGKLSPAGRHVL